LHIGVFAVEELVDPFDGERFDLADVFAVPIITVSGIAFGVFIGQNPAHGVNNGWRSAIFGGDEFGVLPLALEFTVDNGSNGGINYAEMGMIMCHGAEKSSKKENGNGKSEIIFP
jgi:hypothetical protein